MQVDPEPPGGTVQAEGHRETKDAPAYALVVARADRKLGKQIDPSNVDCVAVLKAMMAGGRGGPPPTAPAVTPSSLAAGPGSVVARDVSIQQLAQLLSVQLQRQVVDRTGLTGVFSTWRSRLSRRTIPIGRRFSPRQEQLGLKLESQRAPLEVLVVDGVEQPTAD